MLPLDYLSIVALLFISILRQCMAIAIDNGVVGLPQVTCEEDMVTLVFGTERPFTGRIFVKGNSDNDNCVESYGDGLESGATFQLGAGTCNMRRQRRLGPQRRGVEQSMTVIISFHEKFITKVDRAYRCTCFYMEADKIVTSEFSVSMLPTTSLLDTATMPLCTYSVHSDSIDGPIVQYARVGDSVYHVWKCDSDMFGMLVHSCFVDDGTGSDRYDLLDERGCAFDDVIMSNLQYDPALNSAFVEAHVFKFADKITTYFQCAVSLCMKTEGTCAGVTPPNCPNRPVVQRKRAKRAAGDKLITAAAAASKAPNHSELDASFDLSADRIVVLDLDDPAQQNVVSDSHNGGTVSGSDTFSHTSWSRDGSLFAAGGMQPTFTGRAPVNTVCISSLGFGVILALFLVPFPHHVKVRDCPQVILTASIAIALIQCGRQRGNRDGAHAAQMQVKA